MDLVEGYADVDDLDSFLDALAAIGDEHGCVVQAFDARLVAGAAHLEHALRTARRAIERGESIARDPAVEVLCYAAGTRQIDDALELGVAAGRSPVVVLVATLGEGGERGESASEEPDVGAETTAADAEAAAADAVRDLIDPEDLERGTELGDPDRLREYFAIGDVEIAASDASLDALVRERVALLAVER